MTPGGTRFDIARRGEETSGAVTIAPDLREWFLARTKWNRGFYAAFPNQ